MNWVDYAILAIVFVSALISVFRGFLKEAISLLGWVFAFWVAITFSGPVGELLKHWITAPTMRQAIAFVVLIVAVLVLTAVVMFLVRMLVDKTEITGTDRALGIIFGIARGGVIVGILVLLAGLTALPKDPWWSDSILLPHFQVLAVEIRSLLPAEVAVHFQY